MLAQIFANIAVYKFSIYTHNIHRLGQLGLESHPENFFFGGLDSGHYTDRRKICIVSFLNSLTRAARLDLHTPFIILSGKKVFSGTKESVKVR